MILARSLLLLIVLGVAGCGGTAEPRWASDAEVAKYSYQSQTAPELRLFTVISRQNGSGAHSGLLISTPGERIIFDPAGTFELAAAPERNDVLFGITPYVLSVYLDYHARKTFDVVEQRLSISAVQARQAAAIAKAHGPVPKAHCSVAINQVLRQVPGFESMTVTYFPRVTRQRFGELPGVRTRVIRDDDDDHRDALFRAGRTRP